MADIDASAPELCESDASPEGQKRRPLRELSDAALERCLNNQRMSPEIRADTLAAVSQVSKEDLSAVFRQHVPRVEWALRHWLEKHPSIRDTATGHGMTHGELYDGLTTKAGAKGPATNVAMCILQQIVLTQGCVGKYFEALVPQPLPESTPLVADATQAVPKAQQPASETIASPTEAA